MKTKIKILLVSFVIAAAAFTAFNMAQNSNNMDVSLADIAVMNKAYGEDNRCPGWNGQPYCGWNDYFEVCIELAQCRSMCLGGC